MATHRCGVRSIFQIAAVLFVCVLAGLQASSAATPGVAATVTYQFTGQCADCAGNGIGQLTVSNYTLGDPFNRAANFVSFSYSSNLLNYTITASDVTVFTGSLQPPLPASENVTIQSAGFVFTSVSGGSWSTGPVRLADNGTSSTWGLPGGTTSAVPALSMPATIGLALMLAVIAAFLLKRLPKRFAA